MKTKRFDYLKCNDFVDLDKFIVSNQDFYYPDFYESTIGKFAKVLSIQKDDDEIKTIKIKAYSFKVVKDMWVDFNNAYYRINVLDENEVDERKDKLTKQRHYDIRRLKDEIKMRNKELKELKEI